VHNVTGDHWGGEFCQERFRLLPLLNSGRVELLEHKRLIAQLCALERKTSRGGRDSIDHPPGAGCHDDICNAVAGALVLASAGKRKVVITETMLALPGNSRPRGIPRNP
jgi:hypothetical protein